MNTNLQVTDKINLNISIGQKSSKKSITSSKNINKFSKKNIESNQQQQKSSKKIIKKQNSKQTSSNTQQPKSTKIIQPSTQSSKILNITESSSNNKKKSLSKYLLTNKFLKQSFSHFCNLSNSNTRKKTFDQILKQKQIMSLNKFMIFCKEYGLYEIVKEDIKNYKFNPLTTESQVNHNNQKKNETGVMITQLYSMRKSIIQEQGSQANKQKKNMLQIPVKPIHRVQKKLQQIYKNIIKKGQKMNFEQFVQALLQIFNFYKKNFKQLYPEQKADLKQQQMEEKFIAQSLCIKNQLIHRSKMESLVIQFKGSISYHIQPHKMSQQYLKKPLVMHGGRMSDEIKQELNLFQSSKLKRTQSWINSQPQMTGIYSKSRVFYKPNPAKIYQTNDIIRLARDQTGQNPTDSLFDWQKQQEQQKKRHHTIHSYNTKKHQQNNPNIISFSKIFQDKTNTFTEKLEKVKQQYKKNQNQSRVKRYQKSTSNDDEILKQFFVNQKITYGDESHQAALTKSRVY